MKRTHITIGIVALILLAALAFGARSMFSPTDDTNDASEETQNTASSQQAEKQSYSFTATRSATVLELMEERDRAELAFKTKEFSGLGIMIEEINGVPNNDGYYWILYISGKPSETGAESAKVNAGDSIEWKYEKGY